VTLTAVELNLDELKSGGLYEKHAVAVWNFGTILEFPKTNKLVDFQPALRQTEVYEKFPNISLAHVLLLY
jgi:hypothetical protein